MGKKTDIQIQEAQKVPNKMIPKRHTPRHITIKMVRGRGSRRERERYT